MNTSTLNAKSRAFGLSVAVTSVVSALLVVAKESYEPLLKFMKTVTVHHWVTHGVFNLIVFAALGLLLSKANDGQGPDISDDKLLNVIAGGFLLGCAIIAGFFLVEG